MSSASPAGTADLKKLSLDEKLAFFYCTYVREESIDPEVDLDAVKRWERISVSSSKRKRQGRVSFLLQQIENVSTSKVRHLDANYKAKRELILLAEGTIGNISKNGSSGRSGSSARGRSSSSGAKGGNDASRAQRETARLNNEIFQECGALPIFTQELLKSLNAFKMLNSQQMDVDQVESMIQDLHKDMTLMYLLIVFNANQVTKTCFDRHLAFLGSTHPCQALVAMLDCLTQMNVLPGFPIKRLLLLFYEWFSAVFGDTEMLDGLKKIRRDHHLSQQEKKIYTIRDLDDPMRCKVYTPFQDVVFLDPQDPYYLQKKKFTNIRRKIHEKYYHQPHAELKCKISNEKELAQSKLSLLDDEWEANIEQVYQLLLPRMREYTSLFSNLMSISCGSALNAREKQTFFSRKPSTTENSNQFAEYSSSPQQYMAAQNLAGGPDNPQGDSQYWRWILREKAIVLDVVNLLILLMGKHFRASHVLKGEYYFQFFVEANVPATLTKFMNKDLSTYLQVSGRQGATGSVVAMEDVQHLQSIRPVGFYALENDFEKLSIRTEDDYNEYSIQSTRTITSSLRILQKLSNKKPNIIKNALCRSSSIVWLKVSHILRQKHQSNLIHLFLLACCITSDSFTSLICTKTRQVTS
jgi:hypothetical protein